MRGLSHPAPSWCRPSRTPPCWSCSCSRSTRRRWTSCRRRRQRSSAGWRLCRGRRPRRAYPCKGLQKVGSKYSDENSTTNSSNVFTICSCSLTGKTLGNCIFWANKILLRKILLFNGLTVQADAVAFLHGAEPVPIAHTPAVDELLAHECSFYRKHFISLVPYALRTLWHPPLLKE